MILSSILSFYLNMEPTRPLCKEVHEAVVEAVTDGYYSAIEAVTVVLRCEGGGNK